MSLLQRIDPPKTTSCARLQTRRAALALFDPLRTEPQEVAAFAYLGPDWRLLGKRHARHGTPDSILLSIRDIAADAIAFQAAGVIMAHNHPSGDATPSIADRDATRRIAQALGTLQIRLIEHLIVSRNGCSSFRDLGLL